MDGQCHRPTLTLTLTTLTTLTTPSTRVNLHLHVIQRRGTKNTLLHPNFLQCRCNHRGFKEQVSAAAL